MRRLTLTVIFLQLFIATFAERIDGPANVRTAPKGTPIVSLNDNVEVGCSELVNGWYTIAISLKITKEQYESRTPISEGDSLFNWQDEFIGTALITIPDSLQSTWYSGGAPGNPRRYGMDIYASTYKSNIKPESIPENQLASILSRTNNKPTKADLSQYMIDFKFRDSGILDRLVESYEEQMIYESTVDDPSPMDRIRFIFSNTELVAIVHTRPISELLNSQTLTRGRNIILLKQMNSAEQQEFLEINRKAYAGID
ncbi:MULTISPECIES: hypothetical protein [Roseivirga]|jgi:hypothetical protein|uniref:hypothetical protein n=1 Tax=Roseivirga TaxID=290180 RepID=UPI00257D4852|nr:MULTISPECIES: hypothetical protein [Roseivirga]|tara:strand:+ start:12935 stop:13702 length:768 start_codon:yes stop_codon:yes gene_type:complete